MEIKTGSYTGDGVDPHAIAGVGFQPIAVLIVNDTSEWHLLATASMAAGKSVNFTGAELADGIKSLDGDGFTVGTGSEANELNQGYYWIAFGDGGAADIAEGTYTGNGGDNHQIVGLGINPDIVFTVGIAANLNACWRTSDYPEDRHSECNLEAFQHSGHHSFIAGGFRVDDDFDCNGNGQTLYYLAFESGDVVSEHGNYTGDDADDREIVTSFDPTFAWTDGNAAGRAPVVKHDDMGDGGNSYFFFSGQGAGVNAIQKFSPGDPAGMWFQIGSDDDVNTLNDEFYWVAFKDGTTAGGVMHSGAAGLSGVGALTSVAAMTYAGSATVSGAGTVAAAPAVTWGAASSLSGVGTTLASAVCKYGGAASLAGQGVVTAAGRMSLAGKAALSGAGVVVARAVCKYAGAAVLAAQGIVTAAGGLRVAGAAALSGAGALAANAACTRGGQAVLSAVGTLSSTAKLTLGGAANLSAAGTLAGKATCKWAASAALSGVGTLTAAGRLLIAAMRHRFFDRTQRVKLEDRTQKTALLERDQRTKFDDRSN